MTPIERARIKADALAVLGLRGSASFSEIRRAWRQRAFETHPDGGSGDLEAFMHAKAAFELLSANTDHRSRDDGPCARTCHASAKIAPRRPTSGTAADFRIDTLTPEDQEECYALLAAQPESDATDHVVEEIHRNGRHLVYVVASQVAIGQNRVALPAQLLVAARKVAPSIVQFEVTGRTVGEFVIPQSTRVEVFPGARSVRIRFQSDLRRH